MIRLAAENPDLERCNHAANALVDADADLVYGEHDAWLAAFDAEARRLGYRFDERLQRGCTCATDYGPHADAPECGWARLSDAERLGLVLGRVPPG